ncbi:hypothetical protein [Streptomyces sp. NPDC001851]|uniref:hypothetical protein n=1 Tax=Streptomyces sp. NPDC001851 TaxID=3154529 RepID=UPI0033295F38
MRTGREQRPCAGLALTPVDPEAPEPVRALALRLRRVLSTAGFGSLREIAAACGVGRTTVSDALSGTRAPTWATVAALLKGSRVVPDVEWRRAVDAAKDAERAHKGRRRGGTPVAADAPVPAGPGSAAAPGTFSVRAPYGELPGRVRGRDELLAALERELLEGADQVQVLHGLGGGGKTTVALRLAQYAHRQGRRVFWLSATTRERLTTGMRQVARELGVSEQQVEAAWSGRSSATDLVWRALDTADEPWLLVVDNADEPAVTAAVDGAAGDGTGWIRTSPAGLTVVTSRVGNPMVWGGQGRCRSVDVLSPEDGAAVLMDFAGDSGPAADALLLAERLGGLPLALRLAGAYLARTRRGFGLLRDSGDHGLVRDFAGYARELDRLGAELLDRGEPDGQSAGERRLRRLVGRTWEMSLDLLAAQGLPEARDLMRLLSCFGRAPFPVMVLQRAVQTRQELFPSGAERVELALEALGDVSLLTVEDVTLAADQEDRWVMPCLTAHPLVLETNALQMRTAPEPTRAGLWRGAGSVAGVLAELSTAPEMWKVWQLHIPHITAGIRCVPPEYAQSLGAFLELGMAAQRYAVASSRYDLVDELVTLLMERSGTLAPDDPLRSAVHRAHHARLRGPERVRATHDLFQGLVRSLGPDHLETVFARLGWARALLKEGRLGEAEAELRASIRKLRHLGTVPRRLIMAQGNLVATLAEQGRDDEATAEARTLMTELGAYGDGLDVHLAHLAAHALDSGRLLPEAEQLYRRILVQLETSVETRSRLYLDMSRRLAQNLVRQDRRREALDVLGNLLARYRSDPHAMAVHTKALVHPHHIRAALQLDFGEAAQAEAELRSFLRDLAALESGGPGVITTRLVLVQVLLHSGQPDAASRELDAVEADSRSVGETTYRGAVRLWRARCHRAQGRHKAATVLYDEALALTDDPETARLIAAESAACRAAAGAGTEG